MSGQNQTVRFGLFELDSQCGELRKNGIRLKLQGQPIQILEMLLAKPGELVTREEIQQRLWPADTFVDFDHSLNTAVKKLRLALGDEADAPRYIDTLPKRGYRFIGEVERILASPDDVVGPPRPVRAAERRTRNWAVASCVVALSVAFGVEIYLLIKPTRLPRIIGAHLVTHDAYAGFDLQLSRPLTDGKSVYFQTTRSSRMITMQIPVTGGEASEIPAAPGFLADISRDGSELLFIEPVDPQQTQFKVWMQPLPAGSPRLIVKGTSDEALWTLDGRGIFFTRKGNSELYRAEADGTGERLLATGNVFDVLRLSPDGHRLRFGATQDHSPNFRMWDIGTDGSNPHPVLGRKNIFGGTWSLDGKVYFFSAWDGDRYNLWAVRDEQAWRNHNPIAERLSSGYTWYGPPTISRDGTQLYAAAEEHRGELSVYDRQSGKFVPYVGGISVCYVDFSPDGQWMAYVTYPEGTLWRNKIDGTQKMQLTLPPMGVMNPRWSPNGNMIVFTDVSHVEKSQLDATTPSRIYVVNADGGSPALLLAGEVGDPTWSPDGNRIAYASGPAGGGSVRIFDLQTQKSEKVPGSEGMWSPRWSSDGKCLVALVGDPPEKMALFTFATNSWQTIASGTGFGWESWSHDSKFVYAQDGDSVIRIEVASHKRQQIVSLQGFKAVAYNLDRWDGGWFGLAPGDAPITTRDTGIEGIYALDLEYK